MRVLAPFILVLIASAVSHADGTRVVVLVRHAEKAATPSSDPPLTPAGRARAEALAHALSAARVDAIITTPFQRTRSTAAPLAAARGLAPLVIDGGGDTSAHARQVAAAVLSHPVGSLVVVVGHSNTVPAIVGALGGPSLPSLGDEEYGTLFTLILPESGAPRLVRSSYGEADPPATGRCGEDPPAAPR